MLPRKHQRLENTSCAHGLHHPNRSRAAAQIRADVAHCPTKSAHSPAVVWPAPRAGRSVRRCCAPPARASHAPLPAAGMGSRWRRRTTACRRRGLCAWRTRCPPPTWPPAAQFIARPRIGSEEKMRRKEIGALMTQEEEERGKVPTWAPMDVWAVAGGS
jgi:hypothetical protein